MYLSFFHSFSAPVKSIPGTMQASSSCVNLVIFEETYGKMDIIPLRELKFFSLRWFNNVLDIGGVLVKEIECKRRVYLKTTVARDTPWAQSIHGCFVCNLPDSMSFQRKLLKFSRKNWIPLYPESALYQSPWTLEFPLPMLSQPCHMGILIDSSPLH